MDPKVKAEILQSARNIYEEVRTYDLHYSNIRTTVSTFLLTTALTLGAYLIGEKQFWLGLAFPTMVLTISIINNLFFIYVMGVCAKKAGSLEALIEALSQGNEKVEVVKISNDGTETTLQIDIATYLKENEPLRFRTGFAQTIKDFKIIRPGGFGAFKEIGTFSTTCLTLAYIVIVISIILFKPDNIDTPESKKIDNISKICEVIIK